MGGPRLARSCPMENLMAHAFPLRLDSGGTTLVLAAEADRLPFIAYFGARLPPDEDIAELAAAQAFPIAHGSFDVPYRPSVFPEAGRGHSGTPALEAYSLAAEGGARRWATRFAVTGVDSDGVTAVIAAEDGPAALELTLTLSLATGTGVLRAMSRLRNAGDLPLVVTWLAAPALPVPRDDTTLLSWHGRWCAEFQRREEPWPRGSRVIDSRVGRTSHEAFPGLVSMSASGGETTGRALGAHFGWSGNWRMIAEENAPCHRHLLAGVLALPGEVVVAPGEALETPTLFAAASTAGLSGVSHAFHDEVRGHVLDMPRPQAPRPVHFNSWEAVYFKFDTDRLKDLATLAADVGAERFVLDDGWFPGRRNDRAGLGDWEVDPTVFPDGFGPLIEHVHRLGLGFGLWVEPEMVNPDSALYRAHPDWVLRLDGHPLETARHQLVLDIARPEVSDYLFDRLDRLLSAWPIEYVKWDMNRVLHLPGRDGGRPVAWEQPTALYALLDRLRARHPGTEVESCASGGGRIDLGVLSHTHRFWLSDNNDAHDRWRMNREASVFLPPEVFGHHVGPSPAHTSGRRLDMAFRAFSAAVGGHMGLELDLGAISDEERATVRTAIAFHKRWREVLHRGRFHRLETECPYLGQLTVGTDGSRFLAAFTATETLPHPSGPMVRLVGLDPDARYRVRSAEGAPFASPGDRGLQTPLAWPDGFAASGRALMTAGFRLPTGWPDRIWIIEGARLA
jgi:alpha-galactosidase